MTDYLWRRILAPQSLAGIIENYAQIVTEKNPATGKKTSAAVSRALGATADADEDETVEDQINRIIEAKKPLPNASYFAFTTTPKNKTLEMFGEPVANPDGTVSHRPFHAYTMKQAIQEGFIVDVLENYTPVGSYYKLSNTVEDQAPRHDDNKDADSDRSPIWSPCLVNLRSADSRGADGDGDAGDRAPDAADLPRCSAGVAAVTKGEQRDAA